MGKLHKLRRTIKKDPSKWRSCGAAFPQKGDPYPSEWLYQRSYAAFIRQVLHEVFCERNDIEPKLVPKTPKKQQDRFVRIKRFPTSWS